jgi:hypothetical protein
MKNLVAILGKVLQDGSHPTLLMRAEEFEEGGGLIGAFCLQIPENLVESALVAFQFLDGQLLLSGEQLRGRCIDAVGSLGTTCSALGFRAVALPGALASASASDRQMNRTRTLTRLRRQVSHATATLVLRFALGLSAAGAVPGGRGASSRKSAICDGCLARHNQLRRLWQRGRGNLRPAALGSLNRAFEKGRRRGRNSELEVLWRCSLVLGGRGHEAHHRWRCIVDGRCIVDEGTSLTLAAWGLLQTAVRDQTSGKFRHTCTTDNLLHFPFAVRSQGAVAIASPRAVSTVDAEILTQIVSDMSQLVPNANLQHPSCSCCPRPTKKAPLRGTLQAG